MTGLRFSLIAFCCIWLSAGFALAQKDSDKVYRRGGAKTEDGVINAMTKIDLTIAVGGSDVKISANEITRISCAEEPKEMTAVRTDVAQGNFNSALTALKNVNMKEIGRDVATQEVEFYKAFCAAKVAMSDGGDKEAAEKGLKAFLSNYKESFHYYPVAHLGGEVAASAGNFASATLF